MIFHWTRTFLWSCSFFVFLMRKFTAENAIRTIVHFECFLAFGFTTQFLLTLMNLIVLVTFLHFERAFVFCVTLSLTGSSLDKTPSTTPTWVSDVKWVDNLLNHSTFPYQQFRWMSYISGLYYGTTLTFCPRH